MLTRLRPIWARAYSAAISDGYNVVVASIGNPSPQFDGSRHSVGHWVLDEVRNTYWTNFPQFSTVFSNYELSTVSTGDHSNVVLVKSSNSYMNIQGKPIAKLWQKYSKKDVSLVIVHDELQIPLGKVQIRRRKTSARGHNGLRSIDSVIGNDYTKIAVGIGKPAKGPPNLISDYVLSKFSRDELDVLRTVTVPKVVEILDEMSHGKHIHEKYMAK